jgi:hypothetical protein
MMNGVEMQWNSADRYVKEIVELKVSLGFAEVHQEKC